jgi:hypothetical protein
MRRAPEAGISVGDKGPVIDRDRDHPTRRAVHARIDLCACDAEIARWQGEPKPALEMIFNHLSYGHSRRCANAQFREHVDLHEPANFVGAAIGHSICANDCGKLTDTQPAMCKRGREVFRRPRNRVYR